MKKCVWIFIFALLLALLAAGCAYDDELLSSDEENPATEQSAGSREAARARVDTYLMSVREQAEGLRDALEHELMTQTDMNLKSQELYELWDETLRYICEELQDVLAEDEHLELQNDQLAWTEQRERAVEEAGSDVGGGSIRILVMNLEAAKLTEERAEQLYELLK